MRINEGQTLELTCAATGLPAPEISWTRSRDANGGYMNEIVHNGPVLVIPNVTRSDQGEYWCWAENILDGDDKAGYKVDVC